MKNLKIILVHGNGSGGPNDIWFPYVKKKLETLGLEVLAPQLPESV